jgi:undecaprenyl pyrophosphate phosphatase UppP
MIVIYVLSHLLLLLLHMHATAFREQKVCPRLGFVSSSVVSLFCVLFLFSFIFFPSSRRDPEPF